MDFQQKLTAMRGDFAHLINCAGLDSDLNVPGVSLADYLIRCLEQYAALAKEGEADWRDGDIPTDMDRFSSAVKVDRIASGMAVPLSFRYVHTDTGVSHTAYTIRAADRLEPGEEKRVRDAGMVALYVKVRAIAGAAGPLIMDGFGGDKVTD